MQPLIDGDILVYEVGYAAEAGWQNAGFPPFDYVAEILDNRIGNICAVVEATEPPILYITGKGNFRNDIAKRQPYKERPSVKPWHYKNITAYLKGKYNVIVSEGMEADDLMALEQTRSRSILKGMPTGSGYQQETIICTRDKDLRMVPGWHYGWELGNQPSFGPMLVDTLGGLRLSEDGKKLSGTGQSFFYAQCLTGDRVDTIPGLPKCGAVGAFKILEGCQDTYEAFRRVQEAYRAFYGDIDKGDEELLEQGRLLWMTRELHPDGSPVLWEFPNE